MKIGVSLPTRATEFEDWGYIREVATTSLVFGDILSPFNYIQIGGQDYPSTDTFSVGESSLTKQTLGFTGIATFRLSEDSSLERTFDYESSVLLVLLPTRLVSISLVTTSSVRAHRVQYSVSKENLLLVVLLTSPSLHSLNLKELTQLQILTGSAEIVRDSITSSSCTRTTW